MLRARNGKMNARSILIQAVLFLSNFATHEWLKNENFTRMLGNVSAD